MINLVFDPHLTIDITPHPQPPPLVEGSTFKLKDMTARGLQACEITESLTDKMKCQK